MSSEIVVFVGHSSDANAEASVIYGMEQAFQNELRLRLEHLDDPPLRSVKVWEWQRDARGHRGGSG